MAFKFSTRYFVYDSDGFYCMTNRYNDAYLDACRRSTVTNGYVYILCTETSYLEKVYYDAGLLGYHSVAVNSTNPNIDIL